MRRRTLALGAIVLAGAALLLFCCTGHGDRTASAPPPASSAAPAATEMPPLPPEGAPGATSDAAALDAPNASAGAAARPTPTASASAPSSPPPSAGAGAQIAHAVQANDPRDLELLASIERELKRDPPPEVHALVAARKRGAQRDELTRSIRALPELGLRVLAFRWLDAVMPSADAGAR